MADNTVLNAGTGGDTVGSDDIAGIKYQRVKLIHGADGVNAGDVADGNPLPVDDAGGSLTVDNAALAVTGGGVEASALRVTVASDSTGVLSVDDGGGSLTVDNAALSVTGGGVEATALRVTIATDSTGVLSVDDGGGVISVDDAAGSLTVDNAALSVTGSGVEATALRVTIATDSTGVLSVDDGGGVLSVDDGAGSLTVDNAALAVTGGGVEASALRVTIANDSTGVVSVDDNGGLISVDDGAGSLTVDNAALSVTGGGVEASALRVTIANDSTGVVSVDDNGGALTVDNAGTFSVQATSVIPGVTATSLGKAANDVAGSADTGVAMLAVRDEEQSVVAQADGDYTQLRTDRYGNLKVTELPDATSIVKFAVIDAATSGDNTLVAAAGAGIKIRVLSAFLVSAGTVNVRFESGASGTALTGQMNLVVNSGFVLPYNPAGWFETADNTLLNLELSAAISVDGSLSYVEV